MHFIVKNEGSSPAIEVELCLLDYELKLLECCRQTVLGIQDELIFKPVLNRGQGKYYILCQYKQVSNINNDEIWNQIWLPFNLHSASKIGEVYVSPGELEFKFDIPIEDRYIAFPNKPK